MTSASTPSNEREEDCLSCPYTLLCFAFDPALYRKIPIYVCSHCNRPWVLDRPAGRSYCCRKDRIHLVTADSGFGVWVCYDCVEAHLKSQKLNDNDRAQWIDNDEGLYDLWRASGLSKREFIRRNRPMLTEAITNVLDNKKPAHYLKYGG